MLRWTRIPHTQVSPSTGSSTRTGLAVALPGRRAQSYLGAFQSRNTVHWHPPPSHRLSMGVPVMPHVPEPRVSWQSAPACQTPFLALQTLPRLSPRSAWGICPRLQSTERICPGKSSMGLGAPWPLSCRRNFPCLRAGDGSPPPASAFQTMCPPRGTQDGSYGTNSFANKIS